MKPIGLVISCEHAVNWIPKEYAFLFSSAQDLLLSHRGFDLGALTIANSLSQALHCPLIKAKVSRLLIDCNRSLHHPHCFSEMSRNLPDDEKEFIKKQYYLPFRQAVESAIQKQVQDGKQVWHLSIHTFTPFWGEEPRNTDIGLLYDPGRSFEKTLASEWKSTLKQCVPHFKIRRNYPYKGVSDGFTTHLRKIYPNEDYRGLEIEVNQALCVDEKTIGLLANCLVSSIPNNLSFLAG